MPDLLATKRGRLAAFFFLYLTEGIPLGFTATAVATQMRRQGVGVAEVGAFVAALYLPWAWKWAFGPFVDVISSDRWGRRRAWIVVAQVAMVATLLAALPVDFASSIQLFTGIVLLHNVFAAIQDIAIDALAVNVLAEHERGLANGLMFGGAYLGQAIGGAGVLFLSAIMDFRLTFLFVAGWIAAITLCVALPLRERRERAAASAPRPSLRVVGARIWQFIVEAYRAFTGSRAALVGVVFALLPGGAYALGLALQANIAVELGMSDTSIGWLSLWSTILSALGCVAGGWLSDRFGRRRMLALYLAGTALPTLFLAAAMQRLGWIMPVDPTAGGGTVAPAELLTIFWTATLSYAVIQGLMYGTRTALFMDITRPAVAATQFTAYMAMLNLVIAYSARWQGLAAESWGYPITLLLDGVAGLVCIALLPLMAPPRDLAEPAA